MLCPCLLQVVPSHSAPITSFQLRSGLSPSKDADVALVTGYCCLPVSAEKACLVPLSPHRSASSQLLHLVPIRGSRVLDHPSQTHSNESCTSSRSVAGLLLPRCAGLSANSLSRQGSHGELLGRTLQQQIYITLLFFEDLRGCHGHILPRILKLLDPLLKPC